MNCTVFGSWREPLFEFLSRFDGELFNLKKGARRFKADGIYLVTGKSFDYLFIPNRNARYYRRFGDACVVSCGLSVRDSVSCSSVGDEALTISVLRELTCADGGIVEVQDIPVVRKNLKDSETAVSAAALLLVCGVSPDSLASLEF